MASSDASSRSSIIAQHTEPSAYLLTLFARTRTWTADIRLPSAFIAVITDVDPKRTSISNKLFLETSTPTSASPYPSPSSAFYPPPIPASHEFANKIASNKRYRGLNYIASNNATLSSAITSITSGAAKGEPNTDGKMNADKVNGRISPNSALSPNSTLSPVSSLGLESGKVTDQRRASDAFLGQNSSASPAGRGGRSLSDAPRPSISGGEIGSSKPSDGTKDASLSGSIGQKENDLSTEGTKRDINPDASGIAYSFSVIQTSDKLTVK
jgi:hypothetical protein